MCLLAVPCCCVGLLFVVIVCCWLWGARAGLLNIREVAHGVLQFDTNNIYILVTIFIFFYSQRLAHTPSNMGFYCMPENIRKALVAVGTRMEPIETDEIGPAFQFVPMMKQINNNSAPRVRHAR